MIKGAIFDVDGTLLDSMPLWSSFGSGFVSFYGGNPEKGLDEKIRYFSLRETNEYFSSHYNLGDPDKLEKLSYDYAEQYYKNIAVSKPGAYELLSNLKVNGVKMVVATATYKELIALGLERHNLLGFFDEIITCSDVGASKRHPDIFNKAVEILGTEISDTWVFEDAYHAVSTAKTLGLNVLSVFDSTEKDHISEMKRLSDIYVDSLEYANYNIINTYNAKKGNT